MDVVIKTQIDTNKTRFNAHHALSFALCTNPIYYDKFLEYGLVSKSTVEQARRVAANMQNYSSIDKANSLFQVSFEVGGNLLNKMWRPKEKIRKMIKQILNNEFEGNFVIGIQLR
jgi:hypothetical protein